eukprot:5154431-Pyramimonas_sp.AAC.1
MSLNSQCQKRGCRRALFSASATIQDDGKDKHRCAALHDDPRHDKPPRDKDKPGHVAIHDDPGHEGDDHAKLDDVGDEA